MDINVGIVEDAEEHKGICDIKSNLNDDSGAQIWRQTSQTKGGMTVTAVVIKDKMTINRCFFTEWVA